MRIELPLPSWADAQRTHDDAHTLTVPVMQPLALPHALPHALAGALDGQQCATRFEVPPGNQVPLTLTF